MDGDVGGAGGDGGEAVGDGVLAFGAAFGAADGFFEVGEVESGEAVGRADEDDFVDFWGGEEGVDAAAEDGGAEEGGCEFVEAHATAGSGGDEDGGEFQGWERILGIGDLRLGKKGRLGRGIGNLKLDIWGREGNKEGRKKRGWGGIPTGTVGTFFSGWSRSLFGWSR